MSPLASTTHVSCTCSRSDRRTVLLMEARRQKPPDKMQETVSAFCCDLRSSSRNGLRGPAGAIRQIGVREVTYYRWRLEFSGLKTEHVKRLKDLELENSRLRKAISNLTLDTLILQEAAGGRF